MDDGAIVSAAKSNRGLVDGKARGLNSNLGFWQFANPLFRAKVAS